MTAQIAERLLYEGQEYALFDEPLAPYLARMKLQLDAVSLTTALWRGYVGTWEIRGERLYLLRLRGTRQDGSRLTLAHLFAQFPRRVFAHWYTGRLQVPQGKQLRYVHAGFFSVYESDWWIEVERGRVKRQWLQPNEPGTE